VFVEGGLHPRQVDGLRRMSLQRRLELSLSAIESARELRGAMIRAAHPEWTEAQVAEALRDFVRHGSR
jgi:hypothetical protein